MFGDVKVSAKFNLKGNKTKGFLLMGVNVLTFFLFTFYCCAVVYLFIVNTSFFKSLGVFKNQYCLAVICGGAVIVGFVLFLFHIWVRYMSSSWFVALSDGKFEMKKIRLSGILKIAGLYFEVFVKKLFAYILFILPSLIIGIIAFGYLIKSLPVQAFLLFFLGWCIILISGVLTAYIFNLRYSLVNHALYYEYDKKNSMIIKSSVFSMNGKLFKLFLLKINLFPLRMLSFLILPGLYFLPYCKAVEADYVSDRKKPYLPKRKAHTEKTMVFYFGKKAYEG